jgi:hypothetical protein
LYESQAGSLIVEDEEKILNKFNLVNSYNLVIAGGLIGLALSTNVQANDIKVLLIVSGLLGSYGFWYGGKSKT